MTSIINRLKLAFISAADYPMLQIGWVFGIVIFGTTLMIMSRWLPLTKKVMGLTMVLFIVLEYLGRVHKAWQST